MIPLYTSPPAKIGKHEWRVIVVHDATWSRNRIQYQWRRIGSMSWSNDKTWAGVIPESSYGMPQGLVRLFERNRSDIAEAIARTPTNISRKREDA